MYELLLSKVVQVQNKLNNEGYFKEIKQEKHLSV